MNNNAAFLRTLIIYAVCVPLAIMVGGLVTSAGEMSSRAPWIEAGLLLLLLCLPILLRWHHLLLILSWNLPVTIFFLPAAPQIWLPMLAMSLGISMLQRAMNQNLRFIPTPQITWPLLCLIAVELATAKLTGGFGLHSLGNEVAGGKKYVFLMAGILGFFAFTARRIPPHQARLCVALYFLSGCVNVVGDLISFLPGPFQYLYLFFPADSYVLISEPGAMRFAGAEQISIAVFSYMLARYGIGGIFRSGKPWRVAVFILFIALGFFGGFRGLLLNCALLFSILFFLEGLHRTRLLPLFASAGLLAMVCLYPLADRLPFTFQRAMAILPANIAKINPAIRADAQASSEWRVLMWKALLPQVSSHLLLGKGYAITREDMQFMGRDSAFRSFDPAQQALALSGDYHNGPLSVILPFGIWGAIGFLWFLIAGVWALNLNRLYGDPALHTVNTFLFAAFLAHIIFFFGAFGSLSLDIVSFAGVLGLGISLNGGICRPARQPAAATDGIPAHIPVRPRLQPAFQR